MKKTCAKIDTNKEELITAILDFYRKHSWVQDDPR